MGGTKVQPARSRVLSGASPRSSRAKRKHERMTPAFTGRALGLHPAAKPIMVARHFGLLGEENMATGTVKWFNETKGFGFIQPDDGGTDVFVHISAVQRAGLRGLNDGQKITYELVKDRRTSKMSADNLQA